MEETNRKRLNEEISEWLTELYYFTKENKSKVKFIKEEIKKLEGNNNRKCIEISKVLWENIKEYKEFIQENKEILDKCQDGN